MLQFVLTDTGERDFLRDIEAEAPRSGLFVLELRNAVAHAAALQARHGFFVISEEHLLETVTAFLARLVSSPAPLTDAAVEAALAAAADEEVRWLQAFTEQMRPPAVRGGDPRPARRGGWADVTTALVNGFTARVGNGPVKRFPVPAVRNR